MFDLGTIYVFFRNLLFGFVFERERFSYQTLEQIHQENSCAVAHVPTLDKHFSYCLPYSHQYVRTAVWSFKFRNNKPLAEYFAQILSHEVVQSLEQDTAIDLANTIIITVPSSKESNRSRGFDSNHEIARHISRLTRVTYIPHVFIKKSGVPKQSRTKTKEERLSNPINAFILKKPEIVKNKNIILFDDVLTTGATAKEITKLLIGAGVSDISIFVLAH